MLNVRDHLLRKIDLVMTNQITTALTALKKSYLRSQFKFSDKDRKYIQDRGIDIIHSHAIDFTTI